MRSWIKSLLTDCLRNTHRNSKHLESKLFPCTQLLCNGSSSMPLNLPCTFFVIEVLDWSVPRDSFILRCIARTGCVRKPWLHGKSWVSRLRATHRLLITATWLQNHLLTLYKQEQYHATVATSTFLYPFLNFPHPIFGRKNMIHS